MPLINLRNLHLAFGGEPLLDGIDLTVEAGERICLLGRNGSGKTTLMKVVAGEIPVDDGDIVRSTGIRIARLEQDVPGGTAGTVFELVAQGLGKLAGLVNQYHQVSRELAAGSAGDWLKRLEQVQHELEAANGWQAEQQVEAVISRLSLDPDTPFSQLSGGVKRRVLLARALVNEPDLLLLDEPTNHLDIDSINWLETFLQGYRGSLLFITHDRRFMRDLATRILELDRGQLTDWPGDYDNFLRRKEELLHAEALANARFDKKLSDEERWIRQGIKARRTRNQGRVRALRAMREERSQRREQMGEVRMQVQAAERSGKLVVEAEGVNYSWDNRLIIADFSTVILRGDRIGVIGPNGVGKTTLLNLLLGRLSPQSGHIRMGTRLEVAYFDQMRAELDEEKSVRDNLAGGSDKVNVGSQSRHVVSYLKDFLFTPDRAQQPVKALSGGERNRLLLARLFTRPANLLVLDEPTNDLDVETLELLEERLLEFPGTLLVVSHDREFLDNVVSSSLVFEGNGRVNEYVGGYEDWQRQRKAATNAESSRTEAAAKVTKSAAKRPPGKLSYKDQRELEALPKLIETLEQEVSALQAAMAEPGFYQQDSGLIADTRASLEQRQQKLDSTYTRWEKLETLASG